MPCQTSLAVELKECWPLSLEEFVGPTAPSNEDLVWYLVWDRDRLELISLFKLADDSVQQITQYLYLGTVIVAMSAGRLVGHVQVIGIGPDFELKSLAVVEHRRGRGIGGNLLDAVVRYCRGRGGRRLTVSTAVASFSALRFYLRRGFRLAGVMRDAYAPSKGYPADARLDGVPLLDALLLDLVLEASSDAQEAERCDCT